MIYLINIDNYMVIWEFGNLLILSSFFIFYFLIGTYIQTYSLIFMFGYFLYNTTHTDGWVEYSYIFVE